MPSEPSPTLDQRILARLRKDKRKYSLVARLARGLKADAEAIDAALDRLAADGEVVRVPKGKVALASRLDLVTGRLEVGRRGDAVVIPDLPDAPIRIARNRIRPALDGDRVLIEATPYRSGRGLRSGTIKSVLARGRTSIVGVLERAGDRTLVPNDARIDYIVAIRGATLQDELPATVNARIVEYPSSHRDLTVEIERVLGPARSLDTEVHAVCLGLGIAEGFPEAARAEADAFVEPSQADLRGREDLRACTTFTIDGADARDFDDAVAIEAVGKGFQLTVSIADVSHYVRPGSALDEAAHERATSVYFPTRAVPMLPERLSNDLASLRPNLDRLTVSVSLAIDERGRVGECRMSRSAIRSVARLTYEEVQAALDGAVPAGVAPAVVGDLETMARCAKLLHDRRIERGALDLDIPEPLVGVDEDGEPTRIERRPRLFAHRLIEEFMLATNEAVATHLERAGAPFLYRIHERPDSDSLLTLATRLRGIGMRLDPSEAAPEPRTFQRLLEAGLGDWRSRQLNLMVLRALTQARYSAHKAIHFGLASPCYTHFTSPIRRYPDLVTHRALVAALEGSVGRLPSARALEPVAAHCSQRERRAMDAERDVVRAAAIQYMKAFVGSRMTGTVSSVERFGYFVELDSAFVEGFVPVGRLSEYYDYVAERMELCSRTSNASIRIGDRVEIRVAVAEVRSRTLEFEPIERR